MNETTFDPNRRLCPDGACVGVIGPDSRCTVCGSAGDGSAGPVTTPAEAATDEARAAEAADAEPAGFDVRRRLCDDGSCVGLVGVDGVCATCGKKTEPKAE